MGGQCLEELIEPVVDSQYLPRFRYFKLAENEVSLDYLNALNNLISVLFQVETLDPDLPTLPAAGRPGRRDREEGGRTGG